MRSRLALPGLLVSFALASGACGDEPTPAAVATDAVVGSTPAARDWSAHPAVLTIQQTPPLLYALSDIHGGFDRAATLLAKNGLLAQPPNPPSTAKWAGGTSILVVVGDLIDKGPQSIEVVELLMALEADAAAKGGRVVVTLGNHEAEFFADPNNSKATGAGGVDIELNAEGVHPADLADGHDPRGAWLRNRPLALLVGTWFFAHAGDAGGLTTGSLETLLEGAVNAHPDFNAPAIVGASSILESRDWYRDSSAVRRDLSALGATHIVFGHDPNAVGPRGAIAVDASRALLRIDCGLSPLVNDSSGKLLRVRHLGATDVADELDSAGTVRPLFTAAAP
jgi:hypothetical protein